MRGALILSVAIFLSGALQTLALSPYDYWVASIGSLVLFLALTKALDPNSYLSPKSAFYHGWLIGFGLFASGASWVYVSINTYGNAPPALAGFLTLFFVAALGLFHGFMFWLYSKLKSKYLRFNVLLFATLWVGNDLVRSVFLTGFPWLFIGDSQLDGPLSGWLPLIGSYGTTLILSITSGALVALSIDRQHRTALLVTLLLIALWTPGYLLKDKNWTVSTGKLQEVALIQLNIPQELKWKSTQRHKTIDLLRKMTEAHLDKDVIFWPETAVPLFYTSARPLLSQFGRKAEAQNATIVTGIPYSGWDSETKSTVIHNSVLAIGNGEGIYHKQKLVPFGEYVPMQDVLRGLIEFFDLPMSNFRKGEENQSMLSVNGFSVSPFICYEVVYPDFVANRSIGADYLLTISNDAWFGESIGPLQHLQLARLRALENGRYMVRATNNGVTAIINTKGQIEEQIPQFSQGTLEGQVRIYEGETPFSRVGSMPIQILCIFTVFIGVSLRWRSNSNKAQSL
jgi:apolipoprotein N-acyltransferase